MWSWWSCDCAQSVERRRNAGQGNAFQTPCRQSPRAAAAGTPPPPPIARSAAAAADKTAPRSPSRPRPLSPPPLSTPHTNLHPPSKGYLWAPFFSHLPREQEREQKRDAMTGLRLQKRLAASVLGVGQRAVWLDPMEANEISMANSREYIARAWRCAGWRLRPPRARRNEEDEEEERLLQQHRLFRARRLLERIVRRFGRRAPEPVPLVRARPRTPVRSIARARRPRDRRQEGGAAGRWARLFFAPLPPPPLCSPPRRPFWSGDRLAPARSRHGTVVRVRVARTRPSSCRGRAPPRPALASVASAAAAAVAPPLSFDSPPLSSLPRPNKTKQTSAPQAKTSRS
jgi:hypothetical protein